MLFLYGLQSFSREIQELGRDWMPGMIDKLTRNRFSGFMLGAAFTAIVQSSSAVTATGECRSVVVPSPSLPCQLRPQHHRL